MQLHRLDKGNRDVPRAASPQVHAVGFASTRLADVPVLDRYAVHQQGERSRGSRVLFRVQGGTVVDVPHFVEEHVEVRMSIPELT